MADDYTLAAHPYVPPVTNPLDTLKGIESYRILQNQNKITGLEAQQKQIDTDALKNYGDNGDSRVLKGATPELRTGAESGEKGSQENQKDVMSRKANYILNEDNPKIKQYLWDETKKDWISKGWINPQTAGKYPIPNDEILSNIARGSMSVPQYGESSGETAGRQEAAKAPYAVHSGPASDVIQNPLVRDGGPLANGQPKASVLTPSVPANVSPTPPGAGTGAPAGAPTPQPGQAPAGSPAAKPGKNVTAVDKTASANPYDDEVPSNPQGHDMPTGKGIMQPGIDPIRQAARAEGLKKYGEEIEPGAASAAHTASSLGIMKASLDKGVTTDRLAELKTTVGGFLYAMTKDADFAKKATGLDVSNQEVFNKESTRMGLTFARQTEGAREAVAAIRIALGANPSLLNTEEGNRKIISIMEQGAKYDQERSKAAQAYMRKNDNSLTGFDTWFNDHHSPSTFTSKAVPYKMPPKRDELQNGVTYEWTDNGKQYRGTYNDGHMHTMAP